MGGKTERYFLVVSGVKVMVESLPRSESSLLSVKLGGLFLRDLTTQGTIFPVLVSPKTVKPLSDLIVLGSSCDKKRSVKVAYVLSCRTKSSLPRTLKLDSLAAAQVTFAVMLDLIERKNNMNDK